MKTLLISIICLTVFILFVPTPTLAENTDNRCKFTIENNGTGLIYYSIHNVSNLKAFIKYYSGLKWGLEKSNYPQNAKNYYLNKFIYGAPALLTIRAGGELPKKETIKINFEKPIILFIRIWDKEEASEKIVIIFKSIRYIRLTWDGTKLSFK